RRRLVPVPAEEASTPVVSPPVSSVADLDAGGSAARASAPRVRALALPFGLPSRPEAVLDGWSAAAVSALSSTVAAAPAASPASDAGWLRARPRPRLPRWRLRLAGAAVAGLPPAAGSSASDSAAGLRRPGLDGFGSDRGCGRVVAPVPAAASDE